MRKCTCAIAAVSWLTMGCQGVNTPPSSLAFSSMFAQQPSPEEGAEGVVAKKPRARFPGAGHLRDRGAKSSALFSSEEQIEIDEGE